MLSAILKHSVSAKALLAEVRYIQGIAQKYFKHDKNIFSAPSVRTFVAECPRVSGGLTPSTRFLKPSGLPRSLWVRRQQTLQLDLDTNVRNNVVLYKYENNSYLRNIKIFAIGQLIGWSLLAVYSYSSSFLDIYRTDIEWKAYIKDNVLRLMIFCFSILSGPLICGLIYVLCARQVKYIILNKGGKNITLTTCHIQKRKSSLTRPLTGIKCSQQRTDKGGYMTLKVAGRSFFYLIETHGTFVNPELFDNTVGFNRSRE